MMTTVTVWHGTDEQLRALQVAVEHNCECDAAGRDAQVACVAHKMLSDQNTMDHLAFVAKVRTAYLHGEFEQAAEWF